MNKKILTIYFLTVQRKLFGRLVLVSWYLISFLIFWSSCGSEFKFYWRCIRLYLVFFYYFLHTAQKTQGNIKLLKTFE